MRYDISIITPHGSVSDEFLGRDFPSEAEAEAWGISQATAIGEQFDFVSVRECASDDLVEF